MLFRSRWTGGALNPTREQYHAMIAELVKKGIVKQRTEKDKARGFVLTQFGREAIAGWLEYSPSQA